MVYKSEGLDLGESSDDGRLDSALVGSAKDLEEAGLSPVGSPGVGDEPVWRSVLSSPSDDLDGVSSEVLSGGVLVDSRLVLIEVLVDGERTLDWSVCEDLRLDGGNALGDSVGGGSEVLVLGVGNGVSGLAAQRASWGLGLWAGSRSAWGDWVRLASGSLVVSSSDDSLRVPPSESLDWVSSLASVSALRSAAGQEIVWRDDRLLGSLGLDADSVGDGLSGSEGPARSTGGLVTDELDGLALGPLGAGVEGGWDGGEDFSAFGGTDLVGVGGGVLSVHHTGTHLLIRDFRVFRGEHGLGRVDVIDEGLSGEGLQGGLVVEGHEGNGLCAEHGKDDKFLEEGGGSD